MKQEEKDLLLKDLCARLPYGVKVSIKSNYSNDFIVETLNCHYVDGTYAIEYRLLKPYLHPMPDIQDPILEELDNLIANKKFYEITSITQDWLNAHHFDYHGLIEKGLALEAPEGMYKED